MSGFKVNFSVNNQLATPAIHAAALANRPAAGQPGRVFIDTDNPSTGIYRDTGTTWIKIGAPSSPEADTLQTVTDRGNTTTQNVTIGAGTIPVGTIDVRKATASLNNSSDRAIVAQSTPTIPNGASFGVHNVSVVEGGLIQDYQGSATIANTGVNAAGIFVNSITFSSATPQTLTVSQAAGIRAIGGTQTGLYFTGSGAGGGTVTHVAGLRVLTPINTGGTAVNITNNYGLLVSTQTPLTGTINYTNRWGIYQEGATDKNYFAAKVLIGSTTDAGQVFQVNGATNSAFLIDGSRSVLIGTTTFYGQGLTVIGGGGTTQLVHFTNGNASQIMYWQANGNLHNSGSVLIGTQVDAGYKLDCNGTARIQNNSGLTLALGTSTPPTYWSNYNSIFIGASASIFAVNNSNDVGLWSNAVFDSSLQFRRVRTGFGGAISFNNNGEFALSCFDYAVGAVNITAAQTDTVIFAKYGTGLVINEDGKSTIDLRVEGDTDANLFFSDASTDRIGIGTGTPAAKLHLNGTLRIDGQSSATAGGSSGQHLIINLDGTQYKIALLNP